MRSSRPCVAALSLVVMAGCAANVGTGDEGTGSTSAAIIVPVSRNPPPPTSDSKCASSPLPDPADASSMTGVLIEFPAAVTCPAILGPNDVLVLGTGAAAPVSGIVGLSGPFIGCAYDLTGAATATAIDNANVCTYDDVKSSDGLIGLYPGTTIEWDISLRPIIHGTAGCGGGCLPPSCFGPVCPKSP